MRLGKNIFMWLLTCLAALATVSCSTKKTQAPEWVNLVVGTYTDSGSKGIYSMQFDQNTGEARFMDSLGIVNPSFLKIVGSHIYAVSETNDQNASLSAISYDPATGSMELMNTQKTGGEDPCYVDVRGRVALTANYSGGSMSVFPIREDGSLGPRQAIFGGSAREGAPSPLNVPHVHCTRFMDDGSILATDFSADRLLRFEVSGGKVGEPSVAGMLEEGSAPRHIEFSSDERYVYVMSEFGGTVTVFSNDHGLLTRLQVIASDSLGGHGGADVHLSSDGRFLYSSNRLKADGISVFSVDQQTGLLCKVGYQLTGIHPRNFNITPNGRYLLCACRDSNEIQIFERDPGTGLLTLAGSIPLKKPVCLQFA